jgi:hypothetical protein
MNFSPTWRHDLPAPAIRVRPALLGIQAGPDYWLLDLADSGEIVPLTPLTERAVDQTLVRGYRQHSRQPVLGGRPVGLSRQGSDAAECQLAATVDRYPPWQQRRLAGHRMIGLRNVEALHLEAAPIRRTGLGAEVYTATTKGGAGRNSRCGNCWPTRRSWTLAFEPFVAIKNPRQELHRRATV